MSLDIYSTHIEVPVINHARGAKCTAVDALSLSHRRLISTEVSYPEMIIHYGKSWGDVLLCKCYNCLTCNSHDTVNNVSLPVGPAPALPRRTPVSGCRDVGKLTPTATVRLSDNLEALLIGGDATRGAPGSGWTGLLYIVASVQRCRGCVWILQFTNLNMSSAMERHMVS